MYRLNRKKKEKLFTFFVVVMPIIDNYCTHFLNKLRIGEFIGMIIVFFLCISTRKKLIITNKTYWMVIIYICFISLINTFSIDSYSMSDTAVRIGRVLFSTFIALGVAPQFFDFEYGKKVYIKLSVICSVALLLQFTILQLFNRIIPLVLPNMNLAVNYPTSADYYAGLLHDFGWYGKGLRVSGFFLEPSHFCEYVIFSLVFLMLLEKKTVKDWGAVALITIAIAISRSSIGFFSMILIFGFVFFNILKKKKISSKKIIIVMIFIVIGLIGIWKFGLLEKALWRVSTVDSDEATTGNLRLLRGFIIYGKMPLLYKVIGMGFGNFGNFIEAYHITTKYDLTISRTNEYMNSISIILTSGGIIGMVMYFFSIISIFMRNNNTKKMIFCIFVLLLFTSGNFFYDSYMLSLIFVTHNQRKNALRLDSKQFVY